MPYSCLQMLSLLRYSDNGSKTTAIATWCISLGRNVPWSICMSVVSKLTGICAPLYRKQKIDPDQMHYILSSSLGKKSVASSNMSCRWQR